MADSGTLATTAQVLLGIGANANAVQVLEANTNRWILYAESEMSAIASVDLVTKVGDIGAKYVQFFAKMAVAGASIEAINQDQNAWGLATTQSKLNVHNRTWDQGVEIIKDKDKIALMGLTIEE